MAMLHAGVGWAQFGGASAVDIIGDEVILPTQDQNTPDIDSQTQTIAQSVTSGGGAGWYVPDTAYLTGVDTQLFGDNNVISQSFPNLFPGWKPLPAVTHPEVITATTLNTFGAALANAQSDSSALSGENFQNIENDSQSSTAVLTQLRVLTEAVLAVAHEDQHIRQLLIDLVATESTAHAQSLSAEAQMAATTQQHFFSLGSVSGE